MIHDEILERLQNVRPIQGGWSARCPAHEDRRNSLSIGRGKNDCVLLHCHAGCNVQAIVDALGLRMADLFPRGSSR